MSAPAVDRISFVSYISLNENGMQYIGSSSSGGSSPNSSSNSAARSRASGSSRKSLHTAGHDPGRDPDAASHSAWHVTERSPRMLRVANALSWPASGIATSMPNCCSIVGSDMGVSILPKSSGVPV